MTAETALVARLGSTAAVTALVGARIYPMLVPQTAALPAIAYQKISPGFLSTLRRTLGLAGPRIQVNSWASSYKDAKAVARAVRNSLNGYDANGVAALLIDERDLMNPDGPRHAVSQDYSIWVDEEL